jgi:hypothetical protein
MRGVDKATVYQFEYFDRASGTTKVSADFATEGAIRAMGATMIPETRKVVPLGEVTFSGLWRAPQRLP